MTNRELADRLTEARARTLLLIAGMSDDDLERDVEAVARDLATLKELAERA